jgi:DNA-directed RNA polymerase specialized sigma subunit
MNKFIKISKELVPVSEELYKEYYKMARRERYLEKDIKVGRIDVDMTNEKVTFVDSKEDSVQRLMEQGLDLENDTTVEEIICDKAMLVILQEAMAELEREDKEIIQAIYYKKLTTREISERESVCQTAIVKRHKKVLEKLKKYFL